MGRQRGARGSAVGIAGPVNPGLLFLAALIAYWLPLTLLITGVPAIGDRLCLVLARCLEIALNLLGQGATRQGVTVVFAGGGAFAIVGECTGIFPMIIFSAAVLAAPVAWRKKAIGILWGVPALFAINLLRLIAMALVQRYQPDAFEFFHEYAWQVAFGGLVVLIFWFWARDARFRP